MAEEDLGTAYTGQDDINDKLLLDLAWERQQKKVRAHAWLLGCALVLLQSSVLSAGRKFFVVEVGVCLGELS